MSDKKITDLPVASAINPGDVSVLVSNGTDYQFAFTALLQLIGSNVSVGANITFGTLLPQNTTGKNGDVFINTATGSFAQKINGAWTIVYTISSSSGSTDGTVLYGLGVPGTSTGNNNDTYINTGTGIFYKKSGGNWGQIFSMQSGPAGAPGTPGTAGSNGTNGFSVLSGTATPSNSTTGVDGDFYINTTTYTLFGPKISGNWGTGISLIGGIGLTGPAGQTGAVGPTGPAGPGLTPGGTAGQLLKKVDNTDYNTTWEDNSFANLTGSPTDNQALSTSLTNLQNNINGKQSTLGFTPENTANKNTVNGYAGLDSNGKLLASQWPAGIDQVIEYASLSAFPVTGNSATIYLALDTSKQYRWSGSTYIVIDPSPGSTDAITEGSTNLYFTIARVLAAVLTGITFGAVSAVTAADSILTAFGKLQAQLTSIFTALSTGAVTINGGGLNISNGTNSVYVSNSGLKVNDGTSGVANFTAIGRQALSMNYAGVDYILSLPLKNSTLATLADLGAAGIAAAVAAGTNTYTATISPAITAYSFGQAFFIQFANANNTISTLNLNTLGAVNINKPGISGTTPLSPGDLQTGQTYLLFYDGSQFIVIGGLLSGSGSSNGSSSSKISYNFYQSTL